MINSIKLIEHSYHQESNGDLVVAEGDTNEIPFSIARIFNVRAQNGNIHGQYAHQQCTQLLICTKLTTGI